MLTALVLLAAVVVIWLGYPLVVLGLAALRRERRDVPTLAREAPRVSVVLASREEADVIRRRIADLLAGDYPADRLEIVVALDAAGARARVAELVDAGLPVRAVVGDAPGGKAATLNAGVRDARGEILVFTDSQQTFERHAISRLVATLADDPRLGAVSGRLEIPTTGGVSLSERYWQFERVLRRAEARVHSTVGVTGAVYAMRRALWMPLPAGLILDDVYVPMSLVVRGHRVGFCDVALATDGRRFAPRQEFHRKVRTLTGVLQLCAWLPAVLAPLRNPIWAQFVFHKLLRLLTPYLLLAAAVAAGVDLVGRLDARSLRYLVAGSGLLLGGVAVRRRWRDRLVRQVTWAAAMQMAIVVATANGLRGRWNVWQR